MCVWGSSEIIVVTGVSHKQGEGTYHVRCGHLITDIVYINDYPYIEHIGKNGLDYSLEGSGSVDYTEMYNYKLEEAIAIVKSRFLLVAFLDPDKIKAILKVDLSKVFSASKPILELRYQR